MSKLSLNEIAEKKIALEKKDFPPSTTPGHSGMCSLGTRSLKTISGDSKMKKIENQKQGNKMQNNEMVI